MSDYMGRLGLGFWNGLSAEQWTAENNRRWDEIKSGKRPIVLPESFYCEDFEFGRFIQIQPNALLNDEPGVFVRTSYYGPALKVMIPKSAKPGDEIRIVRESKSGKSWIGEIYSTPEKTDD